ncbi:hypothetical protein K4F52_009875 [Lecanicillium sp. MT-2017a]|nr:hypothetical protein K4F52_009875 [Lecanicillium sp. MT-2017a]
MKGDPQFVILKYHAWPDARLESKLLGAIIKEPLKPTNNYIPESPLKYNHEELFEGSLTDFVLANTAGNTTEASAKLKSIASISFNGQVNDAVNLNGKIIRYKRLQQIDNFWEALIQDKTVQQKLPMWISYFKPPPCLVVGIMVCEDVEISFAGEASRQVNGQVELPIGAITVAAGLPGGAVDVQASAGAGVAQKTATIFNAAMGQGRIFALELQKITTKGIMQNQMALSRNGPKFDAVRLAGRDVATGVALSEPVTVDKLIRVDFVAEEHTPE